MSQGVPRSRLFRKYALLLVSLLSIVLVTGSLIEMYFSYRANKQSLIRIQKGEAQIAAAKIEEFITEVERHVELIAESQWDVQLEQRTLDYLLLLRQVPGATSVTWMRRGRNSSGSHASPSMRRQATTTCPEIRGSSRPNPRRRISAPCISVRSRSRT